MSILIMLLKYVLFFVKIVIGLYHYDQWGGKSGALSLQKTHHVKSIMSDLLVLSERAPHGRMCHVNFSVSNVASSRNIILPLFFLNCMS